MANLFPRWTNFLPVKVLLCALVTVTVLTGGVWYYVTQAYTRVGYQPVQPVPFSHALHVTQLGMDCRYCHSNVETSSHSNVPTTQTCMNCHQHVAKQSAKLDPVRKSYEQGTPMEWVKIHQVPDFAYFNHSVHVARGVSCFSCHGPVNKMEVVWHHESQSMGWCLSCHRAPENHLRPANQVFNLDWKPEGANTPADIARQQREIGLALKQKWNVAPPENCAGCHR